MKLTLIPILSDNYAYLLEGRNGDIAILDPGEAPPIIDFLEQRALKPGTLFCTHHHGDHIGGVAALKSKYGCTVIGPAKEKGRIPALDSCVQEGDIIDFGGEPVHVLETPGHTLGHICYYAPESKILFAGDTLFSMGCGRVFEGTYEQMHKSLQKLAALPGDTLLTCGHEYTLSNAAFCLHIEPDNPDITNRYEDVKALRAQNKPTLPVTLAIEKKTNIFLKAGSAEEFAALRAQKDNF